MALSLANLLSKDMVLSPVLCYSKKRIFEEIAKRAAVRTGLSPMELVLKLTKREDIGSTYVANGFAIPHVIIPDSSKETAVFAVAQKPVHYNQLDNSYADIFLALFLHQSTIDKEIDSIEKLAGILSESSRTKHIRYINNISMQVFSTVNAYCSLLQNEEEK